MKDFRDQEHNEDYQPQNTLVFLGQLERNSTYHKRWNTTPN